MTSSLDAQDHTKTTSRLMLQSTGSPLVTAAAGWQTATLDVDAFARSLNLLVQNAANVISLSVTGVTTGFVYLNAIPAYDGGIYYIPAMPVVDASVTVKYYQVTATSVSIYLIESDEPISVSLFNPVTPTQATSERLVYNTPSFCGANLQTDFFFTVDATTNALRCTVDTPANYLWGRVTGLQSGIVYYDGSSGNNKFPTTPIPIDRSVDTSISVSVRTTVAGTCFLYIAAVNSPDFAASVPIVQSMSSHELAPDTKQSDTPNQLPAIFDGTVAANGTAALVAASAGIQLRVHQISIMQYSAVATDIDVQDTSGVKFFHYHYGAAANWMVVPLFGQLAVRGSGLQLKNLLGATTGTLGITLWYSVL